jgi:excisionase family DNA binding protein
MAAADVTEPQYLTLKEFAAEHRISIRTAYQLARDGRIPTVRVGGQIRVPRAALTDWVEANTRGGSDAA